MLHVTLRIGESVRIGPVTIRLNEMGSGRGGRRVSLGIDAPRDMHIVRQRGVRDGYDHSADDELLAAMLAARS